MIEGVRHPTAEEQRIVDEFAREMQEVVIPEIVDTIHRRRVLAQQVRQWIILPRPA